MTNKIKIKQENYKPHEERIIEIAKRFDAPIAVAANPRPQRWNQSSSGQTYAPQKNFVHTGKNIKLSRGQAILSIQAYHRKKTGDKIDVSAMLKELKERRRENNAEM